jgi:two-component system, response regulator PdtaR
VTQLTVLILDREPVITSHIAAILTDMGHNSVHVVTETGAIAEALNNRPDLMIINPWLSTGSEIVVVNEILRGGYIPHIYLSGATLAPAVIDHRAVLISKPFCETALLQAIERLIIMAPSVALNAHEDIYVT